MYKASIELFKDEVDLLRVQLEETIPHHKKEIGALTICAEEETYWANTYLR